MDSATGISAENSAIFNSITELVASSEFSSATTEFMQKHKDSFSEDDENKLEYTTIFEEYVQIMSDIIDAKLFQQYPEAQVTAFYKDFQNNFKIYEKVQEDTVETLFGFIDFNKFKKQMLEIKKEHAGSSGSANAVSSGDHFIVNEDVFWEYSQAQTGPVAEGWQRKIDHKGQVELCLYQKTIKMGKNESYINKTDIRFKGISKDVVLTYFANMDKYQPKNDAIKEMKVERDAQGNLKLFYQRVKMPLMSERELICQLSIKNYETGEHAGKSLWLMQSCEEHPDFPLKPNVIRMYVQKAFLCWSDGADCVGKEVSTFDMGGYIPRRLINMSIGMQVKKGLEEQYKVMSQLQKEASSTGEGTD